MTRTPRRTAAKSNARRPTPTKKRAPAGKSAGTVAAYLASLDHPHKPALEAYLAAIRALDPKLREAVKWNAPSFALDDHFATFRLNPPPAFQLILHTGAKAASPARKFELSDPNGWVKWAAPDRAVVTLPTTADARATRAVVALVRAWRDQLR